MFTPNFYIDSFQSLKHDFTDKVITDPILNKAANSFIDAQTAWAKMVVENATTLTKYVLEKQAKVMFPEQKETV